MSKRMFSNLKKTIEQKNKKYKKNLKNELDSLVIKIENKINEGFSNSPIIEECVRTQKEINNCVENTCKDISRMKHDLEKIIAGLTDEFKNVILKYTEMIKITNSLQQNLNLIYKNYLKNEEEKKLEVFNLLKKDKTRLRKYIEEYSFID